ncbi:MAG: DUF1415 domain-containing protein [Legionellaceae bacterium]|nr:DUF1415 domain-containing protein [Legionellaceae bacterium]
MNKDLIKQQTMNWVKGFIIEYNICPFAKKVVNNKSLSIEVLDTQDLEEALQSLVSCIKALESSNSIETTLLVFPTYLRDFFEYLDFTYLAERLLQEQGYEGVYQLATFHPKYCFADVDENDVSNYTNRSPYPMIHIIRESSIDKAIELYGNTELIPEKNIETMNRIGIEVLKGLS